MNAAPEQSASQHPEFELEELLAESPVDAARRAATRFTLGENDALALYGGGHLGRQVLGRLRSIGIEPKAFADDTPAKQGSVIDGLRVVSPSGFADEFGSRAVLVVTIFNPVASYLRIQRELRRQTAARIVSFLEVAWKYPETFLPHYQFELPQNVLSKAEDIRRTFHLFADDESRRQFVAHLRFRLHLDFAALPAANPGDYFPAGVVPDLPKETTFVDCGAFDGDTVRRFLDRQQGEFHKIYAFEPDPENFRRLNDYAQTLGAAAERIHLFRAAVGARRGRMQFDAGGGMGSSLSNTGAEQVDVLSLRDVIDRRELHGWLFLKIDVEGAEADALVGAAELLGRPQSIAAVCVYHRPDDLWELPAQLHSLAPDHELFLRTQGEDGMDVVCYAIPSERSGRE